MMKRMLVFLLAALLLCGAATAMADTTAETTRKTVSPRIDAVTAIQNECGKSVFDGYRLYGMLEKANVKSLIGAAEDGSVHLWTVRYDEDLPSPEVSGSELRLFAGRSDFELSTQVAPRYSNVSIQNMTFYDAHEVQLETGITYAYFYSSDELYGFRRWALTWQEDGTLYQADCNLLRPMVTLEEAQDGLDVWLESAFPESGIKAADFEAKLYDNGYIFTTQLKGEQVIDGHYPGTQMVIRYDRDEGVTRLNYYEY